MFEQFRIPIGPIELGRRTVRDAVEDGVPGLAAQLAFYFFLAVFPALLFLLSLLSYLPVEASIAMALDRLAPVVPREVLVIIRTQIDQVLAGQSGGLMTAAMAGAIWSSSTAMTVIISALNQAFDIDEGRPWWQTRLTAVWLTLALAVFTVCAFALVVGGGDLAQWAARLLGVGGVMASIWTVAQWVLALLLVVCAVDLVYTYAPNSSHRWSWMTPGALAATALWLAASLGFKVYVQTVADYAAAYGAIGSIIVLMLWFYVSGIALLMGAELNAEIKKAAAERPQHA